MKLRNKHWCIGCIDCYISEAVVFPEQALEHRLYRLLYFGDCCISRRSVDAYRLYRLLYFGDCCISRKNIRDCCILETVVFPEQALVHRLGALVFLRRLYFQVCYGVFSPDTTLFG